MLRCEFGGQYPAIGPRKMQPHFHNNTKANPHDCCRSCNCDCNCDCICQQP